MRIPRIALLGEPADAGAARLAALLGVPTARGVAGLLAARAEVAHVRVPVDRLGPAAIAARALGVRAVVAAPPGAPPPGWRLHGALGHAIARWVFPSQDAARAWKAAGVPHGRLVVVEPGDGEADALRAVWLEAASMARRPGLATTIRRFRAGRRVSG